MEVVADTDFVIVRKSYLDILRNHCSCCPSFSAQQRLLVRENHTEIPYAIPPSESGNKRKAITNPSKKKPSKYPRTPNRQSKKLQARDGFLRKVPKPNQWYSLQQSVIGDAKNYEETVRSLSKYSRASTTRVAGQEALESSDCLVLIGEKLAQLTNASLKIEALQRSFSYFQVLVFLSYCGLLERKGVPYDVVDRLTQIVSSFREVDRRRLRSRALRVNILIQELAERGWSMFRATEIFFLSPLSPTYLLNIDEEGFQYILDTLTTDEYLTYEFDDCFRPEYTIPGLIIHMVHEANARTAISANEILDILEYKCVPIPESLNRILRVQDPVNGNVKAPTSLIFVSDHSPCRDDRVQSLSNVANSSHLHAPQILHKGLKSVPNMSLQNLENIDSHIDNLLMLFHAMGGCVPKILFDRAVIRQQQGNMFSKAHKLNPKVAGVNDLADLLNDIIFEKVMNHLVSQSRISLQDDTYFSRDESTRALFEQDRSYWACEAFRLCCYVFPHGSDMDFLLPSVGLLLASLRYTLRMLTDNGLYPLPGTDTVEALLSASKFEGPGIKDGLLTMVTHVQSHTAGSHIYGETVYQMSVALRSRGRISESERMIKEFFDNERSDLDDASRRILGHLNLSQANNKIYRFDFHKAREESHKWQPPATTLSEWELLLLCDHLRTSGRILRGEGRFDEAKHCFESCLDTPGLSKSKKTLIVCHLADIYCELDFLHKTSACAAATPTTYLERGREIVQRELICKAAIEKHSKSYRRLLLSLVEIEIRQGCFNQARCLINELLEIYGTIDEPGVDDRVGHVRTLIARARISQLHSAEDNWTTALLQNKAYNPDEEEVFTCGVIYLFIALARFKCDCLDDSQKMFQQAAEVVCKSHPQFLMPGLGTYLFEFVTLELNCLAGYVLPALAG